MIKSNVSVRILKSEKDASRKRFAERGRIRGGLGAREELAARRRGTAIKSKGAAPGENYDIQADAAACRARLLALRASRVAMKNARTPEERELVRMERHEARKKKMREYAWIRNQARKDNPDYAEIDRLRHNKAMREYTMRRRLSDPTFAEKCRERSREYMRRKREAAASAKAGAKQAEVDET